MLNCTKVRPPAWLLPTIFAQALCVLVLTPQLAHSQVQAPTQTPPAPPPAHAEQATATPAPAAGWSAVDVQLEQARCTVLFKGLDIVAKPAVPLRDNECGAPAPVELISVGKSPQVTFYPPVMVTCDLAAALHRWINKDLQPLARTHLGAQVIRIDTMSSYSCRTAYGRKNARLSEHGRANAVDIRAFLTADGKTADVLTDWGPTGREIAAQVATAKKSEAERLAVGVKVTPAPATANVATGTNASPAPAPVNAGRPAIAIGTQLTPPAALSLPSTSDKGLGLTPGGSPPQRLGGPEHPSDIASGPKTDFLRAAHASACKVFGTVLGPEANAAHRNHFHVDMAERKIKTICE